MRLAFIVGCPRSGTTLLLDVYRAHHEVVHVDQPALGMTVTHTSETDCMRLVWGDDNLRTRFELLAAANPGKLLVEKTPWHVFGSVPRMRKVFPEALVIATIRDPRDNAVSMIEAVRDFGWDWEARTFAEAFARWNEALPGIRAADVVLRYEDAMLDRRAWIVKAYRAVGFPDDDAAVDAAFAATEGGRNVLDMKPGFYHGRMPGAWKERLTAAERDLAAATCGQGMAEFGYM